MKTYHPNYAIFLKNRAMAVVSNVNQAIYFFVSPIRSAGFVWMLVRLRHFGLRMVR